MVTLAGRAVPISVVKGETMHPYPPEVYEHMKAFYDSLSEKDRRRYAAVEAEKLGHGGVEYIASVLGCDEKTIRQGRSDVRHLPEDEAEGRIRKKGGPQES
jgi:hypothetical protein